MVGHVAIMSGESLPDIKRPGEVALSGPIHFGAVLARDVVIPGADLGYLTLGTILCAVGLITLLLMILRDASREILISLFGAMSFLWGVRFLFYTGAMPVLLVLDPALLDRIGRGCTYFGAAAAFGFTRVYLGPGWGRSLQATALVSLVFAVVASALLGVDPDRDLMLPAFSVMILAGVVAVMGNALHQECSDQARHGGLLIGVTASAALFALENLRTLKLVTISFDVEWIGVMVLYITLGRLIAIRVFETERRLVALHSELKTARRIQESLLPQDVPRVHGLSVAVLYEPMSEVAGDIYDFRLIDGARMGILVADVSGHGVPAALIASMVKFAYRAQSDHWDRPELVLRGMNRMLTGELGSSFVTAACLYLDVSRGIMRHANAGHPPLLLRNGGDGRFAALSRGGTVLGQFPDAGFDCSELLLTPLSRMILYTDGIVEASNPREEEFGQQALLDFLEKEEGLPAELVVRRVIETVRSWTGPRPSWDDDLTLLVIDYAGRTG